MQLKNMGELQPMRRSSLCTHADNPALGNTDPLDQQACATIFRPREVVGPPMEGVARPRLTPRDQTLSFTVNELPASFSRGHHPGIISNYLRFGSHAGNQRPENVAAVIVFRLLAIHERYVLLCCCASCGLCDVYGSPDVIF